MYLFELPPFRGIEGGLSIVLIFRQNEGTS